jgi:hypothetical protein
LKSDDSLGLGEELSEAYDLFDQPHILDLAKKLETFAHLDDVHQSWMLEPDEFTHPIVAPFSDD